MHSSLYLGISAVLCFYISFEVIKKRRIHKIPYGVGGNSDLGRVISAHSNFITYTPFFLILLIVAESTWHLPSLAVHALGSTYLLGRLLHFIGLIDKEGKTPPNFRPRIVAMLMTFAVILGLGLYILVQYLFLLAAAGL